MRWERIYVKYSASLNKCIKYFALCGIALCVFLLVLPLSAKAETHGKSLRNGSGCGYKWQYSYSSDQTVYVCDGPCYDYYTNYGYYKHCTSILHSNTASGKTYEQVLVYWDPCTPAYTVEPTCTEKGYSQGCLYCGLSLNCSPYKVKPATGHTEETIPGKEPTCTETGLTEGKKCTTCGITTVEQAAIPATGHTEEIVPGKEPTCTETGFTEGKKCTTCGTTTVEQIAIPATGHAEVIVEGKAATCIEHGLTAGKQCTLCGKMLVTQEEISWDNKTHMGTKSLAFYSNSYHCERWSCCGRWEGNFGYHYMICTDQNYGTTCAGCGDGFMIPGVDEVRHIGNRELERDETHHWYWCSECGYDITAKEEHRGTYCNDTCTICGVDFHKGHDMQKVSYDGFFHDRKCSKCGYSDGLESCIVRCIDNNTCNFCGGYSSIMPHCSFDIGYVYGISHTYQWDESSHWYVCVWCGKSDNGLSHHVKCTNPGQCLYCDATNCTTAPEHGQYIKAHNDTQHWEECQNCGAVKEGSVQDHDVACTEPGACTRCGAEGCTNTPDHYFLRWERNPTQHWWSCQRTGCDYVFRGDHVLYCDSNKCHICNHLNSPNPRLHKDEEIITGVAATCTDPGLTDGKRCAVCGTVTLEQTVIPATGHDYSGLWQPAGDHHIIPCSCGCGRRLRADCELLRAVVDGVTLTVCPVCGSNNLDGSFKQLPIAAIVDPEAGQPGDFLVWHILHPFGEETGVRAAFTAVYESHGQVVPPKESHLPLKIRIRLPIDDSCVLVRADDAEGKQYTEMDYTVIGDFICFETDALGLFLIRTK